MSSCAQPVTLCMPRCARSERAEAKEPSTDLFADLRSKSIGECKSKQEEDKILQNEVSVLRQRFTEQLGPKKMKEAIVRMM